MRSNKQIDTKSPPPAQICLNHHPLAPPVSSPCPDQSGERDREGERERGSLLLCELWTPRRDRAPRRARSWIGWRAGWGPAWPRRSSPRWSAAPASTSAPPTSTTATTTTRPSTASSCSPPPTIRIRLPPARIPSPQFPPPRKSSVTSSSLSSPFPGSSFLALVTGNQQNVHN